MKKYIKRYRCDVVIQQLTMQYPCIFLVLASLAVTRANTDWSNNFLEENHPSVEENVNPRIIGGEEVIPHSFPYQVGMFLKVWGQEEKMFCGGSILAEYFVLTAAHCVYRAHEAEVILGAHNISEEEPTQQRFISKVFMVHKGWSPSALTNDIAIVRVPRPIQFSDAIQPIRLPKLSDGKESFARKTATISGWGITSDNATAISPVLRQMKSKVTLHLVCKMFFFGRISKDQICVDGNKGDSTCSGDSGGPMVIPDENGELVQHGVVSFGIGFGCEKEWPQVFTKVSKYLMWIYEHTGIAVRP